MARFAVVGDQLYTVNNNSLRLFSLQQEQKPQFVQDIRLGTGIETLYPYQDHLFIGTQTGMHIYNTANPAAPQHVSFYDHIYSCDPVVVEGRYAYVTLRSDGSCQRGVNRLEVIDVSNLSSPQLVRQHDMDRPQGLGVDGSYLFVCDNGLKVYDNRNPLDLQLRHHFPIGAYDVIPDRGNLMVTGADGLYQYSYRADTISLLSKINILYLP